MNLKGSTISAIIGISLLTLIHLMDYLIQSNLFTYEQIGINPQVFFKNVQLIFIISHVLLLIFFISLLKNQK